MSGKIHSTDSLGYLLAKAEVTYGTDSTPTVADNAIIIRNLDIPESIFEVIERPRIKPHFSSDEHGVWPDHSAVSFETPLGPIEDADGGVISVDPLLLAGYISVSTSGTAAGGDLEVIYAPTSTSPGSATIWVAVQDEDGDTAYLKMAGCRCAWTMHFPLKSEAFIRWQVQGLYITWGTFASATEPSTFGHGLQQVLAKGATCSFNSNTESISELVFDPGQELVVVEEITGANAVKEVSIDRPRDPVATWNPLADASHMSGSDIQSFARNGTAGAFDFAFTDSSSSQTFTLNAPNAQLRRPSLQNSRPYTRWQNEVVFRESAAANDEWTLTIAE